MSKADDETRSTAMARIQEMLPRLSTGQLVALLVPLARHTAPFDLPPGLFDDDDDDGPDSDDRWTLPRFSPQPSGN